ncbi:MAG TPA: GatB/YqeY domain-containing protein [Nocardioides sp.]|nr:GatB/YqeY domain-containing protein [Nocardioides sp.]
MSALKDRLRSDLTAAMKAREEVRASTLRMVLSAITNAEVAGKEARQLSDDDVVGVLSTEAKKRREAATAFDDGGRPEMAERERAEAAVIADYLPEPLSPGEIQAIVADAIATTGAGADGMRGMGKVMGVVQPQVKGRADGAAVAAEVRRQLGAA